MNKHWITAVLITALTVSSCQKLQDDSANADLSDILTGTVSEIVGTQAYEYSLADVQSVSVEKYDGTTRAFSFSGYNPGQGFGKGFGHPGPLMFGIPHIDSCATVTVSSSTFPKTITIDYGTGCPLGKRHIRSGRIVIEMSDTVLNAGAVTTIRYENFQLDSLRIELTATLTNLGKNESGNWVIKNTWNQTIKRPNGNIIVQKNEESAEWISGFGTIGKSDDKYYKTGSGSLTVNGELKFSRTITSPLLMDKGCGFIVSGKEELNRNGNISVIDYGDGTCDSSASVTVNDTTEIIDLQKGQFREGGWFHKHAHRQHRGMRSGK
jgi:hypothetical protein